MSDLNIELLSQEVRRKVCKQARRDQRVMLKNAVREELLKQPLKLEDLIKSSHDSIVDDVVKRLESKGGIQKALEDRIDALLRAALGSIDPAELKKLLIAQAQRRAGELIDRNVDVTINKERGTW